MTTLILGGAARSGTRILDRLTATGRRGRLRIPAPDLFTDGLDGRNASLARGVQALLGRQPSSLKAYARRTAASGVWS